MGNFLYSIRGVRSICEDLADRLSADGWSIVRTSARAGRVSKLVDMLLTTWTQKEHYSLAQIDVFSGPAFFWAELVCGLLRQLRKPYVLTLHGGNLPVFAVRNRRRVCHLLNSATVVTTPSRYLKEELRHYRQDIRLLPNPFDLSAYEFSIRNWVAPKLVWLRAFHEVYNPQMAVEVLAKLLPDFPDAHLLMLGPEKDSAVLGSVLKRVNELGVSHRVEIAGPIAKKDIGLWLNKGDIFLNTSNADNTPVSVMEAHACGLCVVSTSVGGIPYFINHNLDGLLVPPDDSEAMAVAVRRLLREPGLARRLSADGRRKVEAFDWSIMLPKWEELLISLR